MDQPFSDFVLPDGSTFDTAVGLPQQVEPDFNHIDEFVEEVRERLNMYGIVPSPRAEAQGSVHAEVGDDEIDVSSNPIFAAAELAVYTKFLGVKVSECDTSINPRFGNFAEDLVIVPDGYEQTYHFSQQTSWMADMAFIDVPKLRLAIDIRPGRMNHSSTNDGKASMLGSRLAWLPPRSPVRCLWEVFNLFQDINLDLLRDKKFAYLPVALGGYGKPVPFGLASNFEAFALRYKQGKHAPLCRELVRRANRRFEEYTHSHRYSIDPVLSAVSRTQASWHDWVKGKSLYAPTCWLEAPASVIPYRVGKHGEDVILDHVMKRLEASSLLVSESDLAIAYEHNQLCQFLVGCETHEEFQTRRNAVRKEWKGLSTFSMRLYGLLQPLGVDQSLHHPLEASEYSRFWAHIVGARMNLRNFLRAEHFYSAEAKDQIYMDGPMKVGINIFPKITTMGRRSWFETADLPRGFDEKPELLQLLSWVKDPNRSPVPPARNLIEDDPVILREVSLSEWTAVAIVTDDWKLCRSVWHTTGKPVCRVPVKWHYVSVYFGDGDEPWLKRLNEMYPQYSWGTVSDSGSIESYEELGFRDGSMIKEPCYRPLVLTDRSIRPDGVRVRAACSPFEVEEDFSWEPTRFPERYLLISTRIVPRKIRPHRGLA